MNPQNSTGSGGLSKNRIETLCDGVFAIAMTLMIFNIKVPELSAGGASRDLGHALFALWPRFLVYAISFVMIGVFWVGHHNQYHYIRRTDRPLLWINIVFLLFVTLIPFSTGVLGQYPEEEMAVAIYALVLMMACLVLYIHWRYATDRRRLVDADLEDRVVNLAARRILTAPAILLFAIGCSFFSTRASFALFVILPFIYILPGKIDRHWELEAKRTSLIKESQI